jgi:hypothetical protein
VGRRPTHIVKIGPYFLDHSWNWIHGFDVGSLLPMNGMGIGPGGMRDHFQMSARRIKSGIAATPAKAYHEVKIGMKDMMKVYWRCPGGGPGSNSLFHSLEGLT